MNELASLFGPATPAMIVGRSDDDSVPPFGLGEPFMLLGGDRLGVSGIRFDLSHEWQPAFLGAVTATCDRLLAEGRSWFRMPPTLLTGLPGAGRTHAARKLARAAGTCHVILNLSDPLIASNIGAMGAMSEALWVSPVVTAMAATRCANPIVTVVGADRNADAAVALASMIDPATSRTWREDQIGTTVDLGEVSWLVQAQNAAALPAVLRDLLMPVRMQHIDRDAEDLAALSVLTEVLEDMRMAQSDLRDLGIGWDAIAKCDSRDLKDCYAEIRNLIVERHYQRALARLEPDPPGSRPLPRDR